MNNYSSRPSDILPLLVVVGGLTLTAVLFLNESEDTTAVSEPVPAQVQIEQQDPAQPLLQDGVLQESAPQQNQQSENQLVFIDKAFTTLSRWQAPELRPLLARSTTQAVNDEQLQYVLSVLQTKLGGLVSYDNPVSVPVAVSGTAATDVSNDSLRSYRFVAHYTEGDAMVSLVLQEAQGSFSLYHFDIQMHQGIALR